VLWAIRTILIAACTPLLFPPGFCPCWFEPVQTSTDVVESRWSKSAPQHPCHCHDDPLTGLPLNSDGSKPVDHKPCCIGFANWDATPSFGSGMAIDEMAVECDSPILQNLYHCAPKSAPPFNSTPICPSTPLYLLLCALLI